MPHAVNVNGAPGRFSVMDASETKIRAFDFTNGLTHAGEALLGTPIWMIAVVSGTDATPNSRFIGTPTISGNITSQTIGGCLPGVQYMLTATVTTTVGQTLTLWAEQYCVPEL